MPTFINKKINIFDKLKVIIFIIDNVYTKLSL